MQEIEFKNESLSQLATSYIDLCSSLQLQRLENNRSFTGVFCSLLALLRRIHYILPGTALKMSLSLFITRYCIEYPEQCFFSQLERSQIATFTRECFYQSQLPGTSYTTLLTRNLTTFMYVYIYRHTKAKLDSQEPKHDSVYLAKEINTGS